MKIGNVKGKELLKYQSVKNWLESVDAQAQRQGKDGITQAAARIRLGRLYEYTNNGAISPDELLKEAKADIDKAGKRLKNYFDDTIARGISHNTLVTNVGLLRGFYTHNDLVFPKRWAVPKRKVSKVSQRDEKTALYDYDSEKNEVVFKNGTLQHFVQNLNFRDQTIALCLLSSGADATDVLLLNVGFVKDGKGKISQAKRFFWHSNRAKTGEEFKTFFSEEATEFLRRYVEQERTDASDDEPLFPKEDGERLDAHALAMNFRASADKMGYVKDKVTSPFRPKRFRHWFRTACGIAHVEEGYTKAMMGHANDVSTGYLERNKGLFEMEYVKVEPYVTVFGINKSQVNEISQELQELKDTTVQLSKENAELKHELKAVKDYQKRLDFLVDNIDLLEDVLRQRRKEREEQRDKQLEEDRVAEYHEGNPDTS